MPRTAETFKKSGPAIAPGEDDHDTGAAAQQTVRIVAAGSVPPVATSAPASVFAAGQAAKPKRLYAAATVDAAALKIESGVPIPTILNNPGHSPWPAVYARMKKGDMVRLTPAQATSFISWSKKNKAALTRRRLGPDQAGVWRTT